MAKIYGTSGARTDLIAKIGDPAIQNLNDIKDFKKNLSMKKEEILERNKTELQKSINKEKNNLDELNFLLRKNENENGIFFDYFLIKIKIKFISWRISKFERNFDKKLEKKNGFDIDRLNRINYEISANKKLFYGAVGELKVINELSKLPDSYYIINDLKREFHPPIYNKKEGDRIYSFQIDHVVIGPSGIFIIETKNWSKKNNKNPNLFSPVKQVERAGFALFVYLNDTAKKKYGSLSSFKKGWGVRKISPKQIVVTMKKVPYKDFQHVQVLSINELNRWLEKRKVEFSEEEISNLVNFLSYS